jgi:hypothetical protein
MSKFYELSEDTIKSFNDILTEKSFSININIQFIGSESQKTMIKIAKVPDQYNFLLQKELIVTINEDLFAVFDDESAKILIEQELDKVHASIDTGKIKLVKPDLSTFSGLINKYGISKVSKANKIEELYIEQKEDGKLEEQGGFIV